MSKQHFIQYLLHLADNGLILGQRLGEWCGHGPVLEQDIALTNIALDLIGQARLMYQYAADLQGDGATEDTLAYLRTERAYRNVLLVEQPNGNFGDTIMRQFLFDVYNFLNYEALKGSADERLAAIATKSLKEVRYHLRFSSEWVIRLGDGTEVSRDKMLAARDTLWRFTGELYTPSEIEREMIGLGIAPDWSSMADTWKARVKEVFSEATIPVPEDGWMHTGGKDGHHTEHLGYLLTDLQYLQRTYPEAQW
ncbi:MAG: 1,2-phenylacetyl-CoA epoxidase subunit PaaC [Saprospiraceae bacterium]|nr:1,2-phenylacetyl-CoA epoxidase subunit PaaC [Saprospiraceae bacterium]